MHFLSSLGAVGIRAPILLFNHIETKGYFELFPALCPPFYLGVVLVLLCFVWSL